MSSFCCVVDIQEDMIDAAVIACLLGSSWVIGLIVCVVVYCCIVFLQEDLMFQYVVYLFTVVFDIVISSYNACVLKYEELTRLAETRLAQNTLEL